MRNMLKYAKIGQVAGEGENGTTGTRPGKRDSSGLLNLSGPQEVHV